MQQTALPTAQPTAEPLNRSTCRPDAALWMLKLQRLEADIGLYILTDTFQRLSLNDSKGDHNYTFLYNSIKNLYHLQKQICIK